MNNNNNNANNNNNVVATATAAASAPAPAPAIPKLVEPKVVIVEVEKKNNRCKYIVGGVMCIATIIGVIIVVVLLRGVIGAIIGGGLGICVFCCCLAIFANACK